MNDIYVLDACALVALIKGEDGADVVWDILSRAMSGGAAVLMHELNLLEVYYGFYRERGKDYAEQKVEQAAEFFTTLQGLTPAVFAEAGRLKATYKISIADAVALAQASVSGGAVLTADHHEMDVVEQKENIAFKWIR
ncbi:MAG: PIN domain-containing protein [Clostridiales bacterium]|jgi:predicted nucleic acid-binding protein|nr:PIN domain-containing protein [Clostridiales bacterium]